MINLLNDDPGLFLFIIAMGALFLSWVCVLVLRLTLDRRVRRVLPRDKVYDNVPDWYFGIGRAIGFGSAAIFPWARNSYYMKHCYNGFDVYAFADKYDKAISYLMVLSISVTILSLTISSVGAWLGFWH